MRSIVLVELVIDGDAAHAIEIVDSMLENGAVQDPINDCAKDNDCGRLKVLTARLISPTKAQIASAERYSNNMIEASLARKQCGPGCGTTTGRQKTPLYCSPACCDAGRPLNP